MLRRILVCICVGAWLAASPVALDNGAAAKEAKQSSQSAKAKKTSVKKQTGKKTTRVSGKKRKSLTPVRRNAAAEAALTERYAALVVNADNGHILYEVNGNERRHPASLTKMMTLYLLFDAMKKGKVEMDTMMPVSAEAASQPPTNIDLTPGDRITVKTAIESLIVRSANDVAVVVAEALGGSEEDFARMMNRKANQLGMNATQFFNPNGLPDDRQVTTAYDLARLGIALQRDFPEYFPYFNTRDFTFRGRLYEGHNRLLGRFPGADGIKTGFIRASGYNLVTSAHRGNYRLIGVVMGGRTAASRDQQMMDMLDRTFTDLAGGRDRQVSEGRRTGAPSS